MGRARKAENSLEGIKGAFKKEKYTLLTQEYRGYHGKYQYLCPQGHIGAVHWNNWQQGTRCSRCAHNRNAKKKRHSYEHVKQSFEEEEYRLLSSEYINNRQKIQFRCPDGHRHSISYSDWQRGQRCAHCAGNAKKDTASIGEILHQQGYKLLSPYRRSSDKIRVECPLGHLYMVKWNNFQTGHRCPYCLHKSEHKLGQILEQIFPNKIKKQGNLGFLGRQRVDYYIEEEKIAIEYDGEQHYRPIIGLYGCKTLREAEVNLKQIQRRDKRKEQLCRENGWRLIRIRYDESLTIQQVRQKIRKESFIKSEKQHFDHKGVKC